MKQLVNIMFDDRNISSKLKQFLSYPFLCVLLLSEFNFQIVGIVLCVVYRRQADDGVRTGLKQTITNSYTTSDYRDPITLTWDLVMSNMECCGVNNYTDFLDARKFTAAAREEGIGRKVPEACCILQGQKSSLVPADPNCIVSPSVINSYLFMVKSHQIAEHSFIYIIIQYQFNI